MALYKCSQCGWSTANHSEVVPVGGCCGKKLYKCRSCGYNKVSEISGRNHNRPVVVRVTSGHSAPSISRKTSN